ncbi:MAG TPA: c-type cytochrome [Candidatus Limnocylindria bacterium]|nr:c-type cytochrome [Candidatus Limnocylindria bacterium]
MQFPISRQGLQDIALFLIAGMVIFGLLALLRRRGGGDPRRQLTVVGILGGLTVLAYVLAFTVAPNIPTPPVPFTARFQRNPLPDTTEVVDAGRATFQANCAVCHGSRALGDGPAAFTLTPRPVNLQLHVPQHAEGEIFYWISSGVVGTGMPAWNGQLSEDQRWQIVRYLQALASHRVDN